MNKEFGHKLRNHLQTIQSLTDLGQDECAQSLLTLGLNQMKEIQKVVKDMANLLEKEGL